MYVRQTFYYQVTSPPPSKTIVSKGLLLCPELAGTTHLPMYGVTEQTGQMSSDLSSHCHICHMLKSPLVV